MSQIRGVAVIFNLSNWINCDAIYEMENSVGRASLGAETKSSFRHVQSGMLTKPLRRDNKVVGGTIESEVWRRV